MRVFVTGASGHIGSAVIPELLQARAEPLVGSGKALVGTSGTAMLAGLGLDRAGTEDDVMGGGYRIDAENTIIDLADRGVRSAVVRLPPVVHSTLDKHGFQGIQLRQIAETIGRHLSVPTKSIPSEQAEAQFGWVAALVGVDNPASSDRTQQLLDWKPTHPGLIADLDQGHCFTPE